MCRNSLNIDEIGMTNKNSSKLKSLNWLLVIAFVLLLIALYFYFGHFNGDLSDDQGKWGTFGDFMGGTLNPLFALLSLFAIIYTIRIQTEELELTRGEMQKSNNSQKEQSESVQRQTFENTFFKMIDLHNQIVNSFLLIQKLKIVPNPEHSFSRTLPKTIKITQNYHVSGKDIKIEDNRDYKGREVVYQLLKIFKAYKRISQRLSVQFDSTFYEAFHLEFQNVIGHYFGTIYQILKFIDNSTITDKERYSGLFRSQFSAFELELLFYHGAGEIGKRKFMPLLIKYEFFEHLSCSEDIEKEVIEQYMDKTTKIDITCAVGKVFGNNKQWEEKIKSLILNENEQTI